MKFTHAPALITIGEVTYAWGGRHRVVVKDREEWLALLDEYREYRSYQGETEHKVTSSDGVSEYTVTRVRIRNTYICECLGYYYRRYCRHIDEVREKLTG